MAVLDVLEIPQDLDARRERRSSRLLGSFLRGCLILPCQHYREPDYQISR